MDACPNSDRQALSALREEFPEWSFILSDRRRWWALRGPLPRERLHERDAFDADSAEELRAALRGENRGPTWTL